MYPPRGKRSLGNGQYGALYGKTIGRLRTTTS
jgi:hypothetical protein